MSLTFNDTSTSQGLCQETDSICGTSSTTYPLVDKARRANTALSDYISIALASDTSWAFDDTNYTDFPIGSTDITTSQQDYSFGLDMLKILKVQCKDSSGNWITLDPIDINDSNIPLEERFKTSGIPQFYDKTNSSIFLYPTPNYTSVGGLKVYYQRDGSVFVSTDTTKKAGIPSLFHKYIALKMSEPYLRDKGKSNYTAVRNEILDYEINKIPEYYSKRGKDEKLVMKPYVVNAN